MDGVSKSELLLDGKSGEVRGLFVFVVVGSGGCVSCLSYI